MTKLIKKIKKIISYQRAKPVVEQILSRKGKIKLNVGCGTDYKKGWVNIDNNSDRNIKKLDLNWDMRHPLPFPAGSVDFIFNEHFIEHLTPEESQTIINDLMRVLKTGGILRIAMPDLKDVIALYANKNWRAAPVIKKFGLEFIKTKAEMINVNFRWWGHEWLYDWEELKRRLIIEAGFRNVQKCKKRTSAYPELQNLETRDESTLIAEIKK